MQVKEGEIIADHVGRIGHGDVEIGRLAAHCRAQHGGMTAWIEAGAAGIIQWERKAEAAAIVDFRDTLSDLFRGDEV